MTYPNRVPLQMHVIPCHIFFLFILIGLVFHPRCIPGQFNRPFRACPCCAFFCPAVTFPDRVSRQLLAIPFRILFFFLLLGIVHLSSRIPVHFPCPLRSCPLRVCPLCALFCARCVERVLFRVCFFKFVVRSVKFVIAP